MAKRKLKVKAKTKPKTKECKYEAALLSGQRCVLPPPLPCDTPLVVEEVSVRVKCKDCGAEYREDAPHYMFCPAHTCDFCGTSFHYVVQIYDSRETPPQRKCDRCMENEVGRDMDSDDE